MEITSIPGNVTFLNRELMPSENFIVCSAIVHDVYDELTDPPIRHIKLLEEMIRAGHWGCLDHAMPTFKVVCPIFVARQILRASNASFNEKSGRYGKMLPKVYKPEHFYTDVKRKELGDSWEKVHPDIQRLADISFLNVSQYAYNSYEQLLEAGVRKEQARMILPLNMYTEFWMSLKLSDWLHFLNLRMDKHAQFETGYIAELIYMELRLQFPAIIEYWEKYAKGPINEYGTIQTP